MNKEDKERRLFRIGRLVKKLIIEFVKIVMVVVLIGVCVCLFIWENYGGIKCEWVMCMR